MSSPLTATFFRKENFDKLKGAICYDKITKEDQVMCDAMKAKAIMMWPEIPGGVKKLVSQMEAVAKATPMEAGLAESIYKEVLKAMMEDGINITPFLRAKADTSTRTSAMEGFKEVDGKIVVAVDIDKFQSDMKMVTAKLSQKDVVKSVVKQSAEQDLFLIIKEMLTVEESYDLIGILAARLLVNKQDRESIDVILSGVTVLKNRVGKISTGLVRLGGFIGLASVKGEPLLASAVKWLHNPILGEDVVDRPLLRRSGEDEGVYEKRKQNHEKQWVVFKTIMTQMKAFKGPYEALDQTVKDKIHDKVMYWTIG